MAAVCRQQKSLLCRVQVIFKDNNEDTDMSKDVTKAADELRNKIVSMAGHELKKAQSDFLSRSITWRLEFDKADGTSAMILHWEAVNSDSSSLEYLVEKWAYDIGKEIRFDIVAKAS